MPTPWVSLNAFLAGFQSNYRFGRGATSFGHRRRIRRHGQASRERRRTTKVLPVDSLPLLTRLWFAWTCLFRVLFDGRFAAFAFDAARKGPGRTGPDRQLPPEPAPDSPTHAPTVPTPDPHPRPVSKPAPDSKPDPPGAPAYDDTEARLDAALQLLALLQREGRLVDFLQQDITGFGDAEVAAAARVVHEGCRKGLLAHADVAPIREEPEGRQLTLAEGFDATRVKLIGNVGGAAPYTGVLRHRGWQVTELRLPRAVGQHDSRVVAPAEVEV